MPVTGWVRGLALAIAGGALVLGACARQEPGPAQREAQQAAWSAIVASHTSGIVSRRSEVRVRFAIDVAPADAAAGAAARALTIEPAVAGRLRFAGPRELVLEPRGELEPGRTYTARLNPAALAGVAPDLPPFEFSFRVQSPEFDLALSGLEADPADDRRMILRGTLTSADAEEPRRIAQLVTATYGGASVPLVWTHASDGRSHQFTVSGLERQAAAQPLVVKWDGKPIASASAGERTVEVPARDAFLVTQAQALEEDGRRQILVYFSDALDARQSLRGLVRLSSGEFTTRIDGSTLVIYPEGEPEGDVLLTLEPGIRNERGARLGQAVTRTLAFASTKPQVRFAGRGVILPGAQVLSVPFEAVSARSVRVTAMRIYEDNIGQFLQVNALDGSAEMGRVGRFLWRRTIPLTAPVSGRWTRYQLDVTELVRRYPGALFQLTLQLTPADSAYECPQSGATAGAHPEPQLRDQEDGDRIESSHWDYAEEYYGREEASWSRRGDPCSIAYYLYGERVRAQRNLIATNVGLLAKRDQRGQLLIMATDLRSARPLAGARLTVQDYQHQPIATGTTDGEGLARLEPAGTPFLIVAEAGGQRGYLKVNAGSALPVSHFDVGGETVSRGLKGFLYGDRGVWRPGDPIHLTFVLQDRDATLPPNHPVTLELTDPRGRLVQTLANTAPVGGFYRFDLRTAPDAPTGDWTAKATLGGVSFSKRLKVEAVMPNRLKIELDLGREPLAAGRPVRGALAAQWLSGATAAGLAADVKLRLVPTRTQFTRYANFVFDDPARELATEPEPIFQGTLDESGRASFSKALELAAPPPGMLSATFTSRVFERGGAFSIRRETATYAPFERFVGLRLPQGDVARDMLLTDREHVVEIATLSPGGAPVAAARVQLTLYKVEWKWWWDRTGESLAQYARARSNAAIREETIATASGRGQWKFTIRYPEWGRYLLRACDLDGGHCSGQTFYVDWPSWAGTAREQAGPAASILSVTADKPRYTVGETATVQLPESAQGRALVTIENGTGILEAHWLEPRSGSTRFQLPITAAMAPNVYVAVTLVQPHEGKGNDRPIRLYGVIPLEIVDPQTRLAPVIRTAGEWRPESRARIEVAESQGRAMSYTLAIVDEGLLTLTNFRTPDPHGHFYRREALGVATWDLFDEVAGSYGAELERLLALGGSEATAPTDPDVQRSRFPPVVRFLGPFRLEAGARAAHEVELPRYIGAVRVMLVAGEQGAYGAAEKSVFVRQPLMLLPTMPRVVGPGEELAVPVSVFVSDAALREVTFSIEPDEHFRVVGAASTQLTFVRPEEQLGVLRLKVAERLGRSRVRFAAASGAHRAAAEIFIEVRSPNPATTRLQSRALQPGERWTVQVVPHGLPGTNELSLEVAGIPPLGLDSRLGFLIQYPHGCLEQVVSGVFPQLYLPGLVRLEDARRRQIEHNVSTGLERLRWFQTSAGGFTYWPGAGGGFVAGSPEGYELWASTYAGHFLIEAEKAGYQLPPGMRAGLIRHLKGVAQRWSAREGSTLDQAYRLFVLAAAGQPEIGAMNRLRELEKLPSTERWILAASYRLAGLGETAAALATGDPLAVREYRAPDQTFGSTLRDRAMVLQSLVVLGELDRAAGLVRAISAALASEEWHSTQSVAYALMAVAKLAGSESNEPFTFEREVGGRRAQLSSREPIHQTAIPGVPAAGETITVRNTSQRVLFATLAARGVPPAGEDDASGSGLELEVSYTDAAGAPLDVARVPQGTDIVALLRVRNATSIRIDNIALTQMVPAGWEIHNERLEGAPATGEREAQRPRAPWDVPDGAPGASAPRVDHADIRDDRVLQYFSLRQGESLRFVTRLNAAYAGRFYLPSIVAEAMYDASKHARTRGQWTEVVPVR